MKSLLFLCALSTSFCAADNAEQTSHVRKFGSQYFTSILLSGGIGAATGALLKHIEKQLNIEAAPAALFFVLLGWTLESEFRNDIIAMLQKDLDANEINHKKTLMFKTAWIASWIAYLQA